jgi:cytochrome bd ubiquinol oxidase subunit II
MSALDLARWQFAITSLYHFVFVPLTIGLASIVAVMQTIWYRGSDERWRRLTDFSARYSTLQIAWFGIVGLLWIGYLVLEGFDFGVGMLLPFLGRSEADRRTMINSIGPVWDGNQVWLIAAGGMMFAAFPVWYATMLSMLYLPVVLILLSLIARGVAFEFRGKTSPARWRRGWDLVIAITSLLAVLLWGAAFGNLVMGIDAHALFANLVITNGQADLAASTLVPSPSLSVLVSALNPYALLTGFTLVGLFAMHGAVFLALRTTGDLHRRSMGLARTLAPLMIGVGATWAIWTQIARGPAWSWVLVAIAAAALIGLVPATRTGRDGLAFVLTSLVTAGAVVLIFASVFPKLLPIKLDGVDVSAAFSTTIALGSSSTPTLTVMLLVACIAIPAVIGYQAMVYRKFSARLASTSTN